MDKITKYRSFIHQILQIHGNFQEKNYDEFETQQVTDDTHGHYYVMFVGWNDMERSHDCLLHIDLKVDKIWIQQDWTEYGVANELVDMGVPKSDIVLAFHAPYKRSYTDFAVA